MFKTLLIKRGIDEIRDLVKLVNKYQAVIAGGYARYCLSPSERPIKFEDIDIFMKDQSLETLQGLTQDIINLGHQKIIETDLAITFSAKSPQIQIIKPRYTKNFTTCGSIEEVLSHFDFTVCRAAILSETDGLVDEHFEEDELTKNLRIKYIHNPVVEINRFIKYGKKGYKFTNSEVMKVLNDWQARPSIYRLTLQDTVKVIEETRPIKSDSKLVYELVQELKSSNKSANNSYY